MKKAELVLIPFPVIAHVVPTLETAKLLINRDERLSITVLIMKLPFETNLTTYIQSVSAASAARIRFVDLPTPPHDSTSELGSLSSIFNFITIQKPNVRKFVDELVRSESTRVAGFVIDMMAITMMDVANEFGVPTYAFSTSSAAFLGLLFHLQILQDHDNQDISEYKDSDTELSVPSFANPVPGKFIPHEALYKDEKGSIILLDNARKLRDTKGIIVNTFLELETHALQSLKSPIVYPVGPVVNLNNGSDHEILKWLDGQPPSSVVFLCFGSMGSFEEEQLKEIANALERSGHRFLWSIRRRPPPIKDKIENPGDYSDNYEVLPEGFLRRTEGMGRVMGWAPQVAVLSHPAVGGFLSHCGWNSALESVWCGVPVATWPAYVEQQLNAFEMVKELGIAVAITMEHRMDFSGGKEAIVTADEIEMGIRKLMVEENENEIRKKVKELSEKSRIGMQEGGSSYTALGRLIQHFLDNIN